MAKFENHIKGNVGQQVTGENVTVNTGDIHASGDVPVSAENARTLEAIVANQTPEKPGFSDGLKQEVMDALKAIVREQARILPKRAYQLLKEFFPAYVKPFLP